MKVRLLIFRIAPETFWIAPETFWIVPGTFWMSPEHFGLSPEHPGTLRKSFPIVPPRAIYNPMI
jgi:hypothetical protein